MKMNPPRRQGNRFYQPCFIMSAFALFVAFVSCTGNGKQKSDENSPALLVAKRVIEAYGGAEAIEGVRSIHARGDIKTFVREGSGIYEYYLKRPGKLRVEIRYENQTELRMLNGEKGWRGRLEGPVEEVTDVKYMAMLYQYIHIDLPYGLLKGLYDITWEGRDRIGNVEVDVLAITSPGAPPMKAYIDTGRGLIIKTRGYFTVKGTETYLSAEYSEFAEADGTVLPGRIVNYGGGKIIGETTIKQYLINSTIDDSIFTPTE